MKILLLNQFFVPDVAATGQLLADVADALVEEGHNVHVVCSKNAYGDKTNVRRESTKMAADSSTVGSPDIHRIRGVDFGRSRGHRRVGGWMCFHLLALAKCIRLGPWDACLVLTTPPFIARIGVWMKRRCGTRLVVWSMDLWPEVAEELGTIRKGGFISDRLRAVAARIYGHADAIISLGEFMTQRLLELGVDPTKIVEIHNWAPRNAECEVRPGSTEGALAGTGRNVEWGERPPNSKLNGRFVVMYSGNMGAPHEFDTILGAAESLKLDGSIDFVFVGSGQRSNEVADAAKRRGLKNVCFLPPQPLEELFRSLATADVHLISMRRGLEGCIVPSKIYAIMAVGRPAIMVGSTENEVSELLSESESGFSVAQGDSEDLAARIRYLRDNKESARKMGAAGRRYYEEYLRRDVSVKKIVRVLVASTIS